MKSSNEKEMSVYRELFYGLVDEDGHLPEYSCSRFRLHDFLTIIKRCQQANIEIYGIETCTVEGFQDFDCYVVESFPHSSGLNNWCFEAVYMAVEHYKKGEVLFSGSYRIENK